MSRRHLIAVLAVSAAAVLVATAALVVATAALVVAGRAENLAAEGASTRAARQAEIHSTLRDDLLRGRSVDPPVPQPSLPRGTLTVHDDGCGVIRSEFDVNPENLGWSVRDQDGFQVLQRNAEGETRYRYFQSGTYTVVLQAWGGNSYVPISNEVTINC